MSPIHPFAGQDVVQLLESATRRFGDRPALVWQPEDDPGRTWSYRDLHADVLRTAAGLQGHGVRAGDRILLHADNCPEVLLTWFACAWLGAVCVVTNPKSAGPELAYFARHVDAVGAVTQHAHAPLVSAHCAGLKWLVVIETDFAALQGPPPDRADLPADLPGSMMFTSGTTARPKAVVWSRGNPLWAARTVALQTRMSHDDVVMAFLPLYHVVGMAWTVLPAFRAGATVVLLPRFSASRFWDVAGRHRATFAAHVQFSSGVLARQPVPATHGFRLWGNSTWHPSLESHFRVPILGWWGMTEAVAPGILGDRTLVQAAGSIGRPTAGYDLRIADDDGRPVPAGGVGQLLIRGTRGISLFSEYHADPDATAAAFTDDGWFRTGDRMRWHADGSLQFVERSRDVIKTGGEGVSPAEVERVLLGFAGVREACVVGRPDTSLGQTGVAFVVLDQDRAAGPDGPADTPRFAEALRAHCATQLAPFKVPREIRFLDALPRAGLGKIAKGALRELAVSPPAAAPTTSDA